MAKASWVNVTPTSGSGDSSISVSSVSAHTGRSARSTTLTVTASGVDSKTVTVNQAGAAEFITATNTSISISKSGVESVSITGTSNAAKLSFSQTGGNADWDIPDSYSAASVETDNGVAISGDPGASTAYNWEILIQVHDNTTVSAITGQYTITTGSKSVVVTITQDAATPYLTVSTNTIELTAAGTAQTFTVNSNTSWTIS